MTPLIGAICNCRPGDCLGCGLCRNACPAEALAMFS